ncbi:methyltransferase domain-containing protein [Candidatus Uhrbacteria bacterium]|nr:methyltransferase domain-containing protein [Candidatus Uhrbacteria bacterium]MBD3284031.1 methyltransferase domain-containing protein [Candidatus Uhrbacteria bacterium]
MQTPAERCLIQNVIASLPFSKRNKMLSTLLNVGAGRSTILETAIATAVPRFTCDRIDVEQHRIKHPNVRNMYHASVESMPAVPSKTYDVVFSNYVFEHVPDVEAAIQEIARVLKQDGTCILTIPNPNAPEFFISKWTPHHFHQWVKGSGEGQEAFPTFYAYRSIRNLTRLFEAHGFILKSDQRFAFVYGYLYRFPILNVIGKAYDGLLSLLRLKPLMGHVCLTYQKT